MFEWLLSGRKVHGMAQSRRYSVAVAGATGYAGQEMLRLIAGHPQLDVTTVTAHSSVGDRLAVHDPNLGSLGGLEVEETTPERLNGHDVVVLALPHGASGALADDLSDVPYIIDLGADHRLELRSDWDAFYGGDFYDPWIYGLPELIVGTAADGHLLHQRDKIKGARRVAGPGCNVTGVTLAIQPGVAAGFIDPTDIVSTAVVGYSGAGRNLSKTNLLAAEAFGSAVPYSVGGVHRHIPEMLQNLAHAAGDDARHAHDYQLSFTPVLAPMSRGILASVSAKMTQEALDMDDDKIRAAWLEAYRDEPFITLLEPGNLPATANVLGSNAAHIQVVIERTAGRILALSAIDNLNRGTAGQAVQSLNLALGLPEQTGLTTIGVAP